MARLLPLSSLAAVFVLVLGAAPVAAAAQFVEPADVELVEEEALDPATEEGPAAREEEPAAEPKPADDGDGAADPVDATDSVDATGPVNTPDPAAEEGTETRPVPVTRPGERSAPAPRDTRARPAPPPTDDETAHFEVGIPPGLIAGAGGTAVAVATGVACGVCGAVACMPYATDSTAIAPLLNYGALFSAPVLLFAGTWVSGTVDQLIRTLLSGATESDDVIAAVLLPALGQQLSSLIIGVIAGVAAIPVALVGGVVGAIVAAGLGVSVISGGFLSAPTWQGVIAGAVGAGVSVAVVGLIAAAVHAALLAGVGCLSGSFSDDAKANAARKRGTGPRMAITTRDMAY